MRELKNSKTILVTIFLLSVILSSFVFSATEIVVNGESYEKNVFSVFVLPKEELNISIGKIDGDFIKKRAATCNWSIPKEFSVNINEDLDKKLISPENKGVYKIDLKINYKEKEFSRKIQIIVLIPLENDNKLNSYFCSLVDKIENLQYTKVSSFQASSGLGLFNNFIPNVVKNNQSLYENIPKGVIEVTRENEDVFISEHFKLKDFVCKGDKVYPKLMCLNYNLIKKLELIIDVLGERGYKVKNMVVMSGFRTPWYNKKKNVTRFSRHIYGDAADIYIDNNNNNKMDDLNRDGRVNIKDAKYLANIINEMDLKGIYPGGLHVYGGNKTHGPFVHVDTRGYIIRW